jgi:hypothetical protein
VTCPICGRLYCDHTPDERGQTMEEMLVDLYAPHLIGDDGLTKRVSEAEYERKTERKYGAPKRVYTVKKTSETKRRAEYCGEK